MSGRRNCKAWPLARKSRNVRAAQPTLPRTSGRASRDHSVKSPSLPSAFRIVCRSEPTIRAPRPTWRRKNRVRLWRSPAGRGRRPQKRPRRPALPGSRGDWPPPQPHRSPCGGRGATEAARASSPVRRWRCRRAQRLSPAPPLHHFPPPRRCRRAEPRDRSHRRRHRRRRHRRRQRADGRPVARKRLGVRPHHPPPRQCPDRSPRRGRQLWVAPPMRGVRPFPARRRASPALARGAAGGARPPDLPARPTWRRPSLSAGSGEEAPERGLGVEAGGGRCCDSAECLRGSTEEEQGLRERGCLTSCLSK